MILFCYKQMLSFGTKFALTAITNFSMTFCTCVCHCEYSTVMSSWSKCSGKCLLWLCPSVWPMNNYYIHLYYYHSSSFSCEIPTIFAASIVPSGINYYFVLFKLLNVLLFDKVTQAYELSICTFASTTTERNSFSHAIKMHHAILLSKFRNLFLLSQ